VVFGKTVAAGGDNDSDMRDSAKTFAQVYAVIEQDYAFSGDLTDTGDPDAYRRLAAAAASLSAGGRGPVPVFATGNHDVRTEFIDVLECIK